MPLHDSGRDVNSVLAGRVPDLRSGIGFSLYGGVSRTYLSDSAFAPSTARSVSSASSSRSGSLYTPRTS